MKNKIDKILINSGIEDYGFCLFGEVGELINCGAVKRLPKNAQTIISVIFPYKVKNSPPLNISRYSAVEDYHTVCMKILEKAALELKENFKEFSFAPFVDNSPINEVKAAALCGLGVIGKNNLLISHKYGSFVFLGEIVTDLKINTQANKILSCINCNRCVDSCPTTFLNKKKLCLSDITQKKKITPEMEVIIKENNYVWGCDICQEVCPMNNKKPLTKIKEFKISYRNFFSPDESFENRAYTWRGKEVIKRNFNILKDNKKA
ncbi:MAG: DUF1730 domain-containing protein [Clostridia bacterium]|nr:DUF1730 domain-containing protein [Clostridia bacterium]